MAAEAIGLVGIYDGRLWRETSRHQIYLITILCRPANGRDAITPPNQELEVLETDWFAEDSLPADMDPGHLGRISHAFAAARGGWTPHIDLPGS